MRARASFRAFPPAAAFPQRGFAMSEGYLDLTQRVASAIPFLPASLVADAATAPPAVVGSAAQVTASVPRVPPDPHPGHHAQLSILVDDPNVRARLTEVVGGVSGDANLREDLGQEALLHLWLQERVYPGKTLSSDILISTGWSGG